MKLTDTHCHLNLRNYHDDLPAVISRAQEIGVQRILVPALDIQSCQEVIKIAEDYQIVFAAIGVHPNSALTWQNGTAEKLKVLAGHPQVLAIGEIGLDYYRDRAPKEVQKKILREQLIIASESRLPVVLHVRNKSEEDRSCIKDLLLILEEWLTGEGSSQIVEGYEPGVIHSFSGNLKESRQAIGLGFYIGITGAVTFNKADTLREVVRKNPLTKLLIETDGPFITPDPFRGKRNEPAHVRYIVDKISEVTDLSSEKIAAQTSSNAASIFAWE